MSIPTKDRNLLYIDSGGICAFPDCPQRLIENETDVDEATILGEAAHIIAESVQGPRGKEFIEDRNNHTNLILLCRKHHKIIDSQPRTYSVAVLRQMKAEHKKRIQNALKEKNDSNSKKLVQERIQSTLLPVTHLPQVLFSAPCSFDQAEIDEVKSRIRYPKYKGKADYEQDNLLLPFVLKDKKLYSFYNLQENKNPFSAVIDGNKAKPLRSLDLWESSDGNRLYINLLNRGLYKYTGRLGIRYLPKHKRFYFPATEDGQPRSVVYRSANKESQDRQVAWEPITRSTGEGKGFWYHLAANLRFHQMDKLQWCLSIRPERYLTTDGVTPFPSDKVGRKVTKLKAKMYNDKYFSEIIFWRDYLSKGTPRFVMNFGSQNAIIDIKLVTFYVDWIGIPDDDKPFKNEVYQEDLFTFSEKEHSISGEEFEFYEWEEAEEENELESLQNEETEIPF